MKSKALQFYGSKQAKVEPVEANVCQTSAPVPADVSGQTVQQPAEEGHLSAREQRRRRPCQRVSHQGEPVQ